MVDMQFVGKKELEAAAKNPSPVNLVPIDPEKMREAALQGQLPQDFPLLIDVMQDKNIQDIVDKLDQPVMFQKEMAAKLKVYLDHRIATESVKFGALSKNTLMWVDAYNDLLEKINKALYGEKSTVLQLHGKVSHAQIGALIRKHAPKKAVVIESNKTDDKGKDDATIPDQ